MDIAELKHQARTLEQQGNLGQALEVYRQILTEIDAIGGIRQELPVLIKIGDLHLKTGDVDQAIDSYERAAGEYATQGAAQPVMSLCTKILRADPQAVGAYLRLARRLLDNGFPDGAREVLIDYAQRGKLDKTRQGLERLAGREDDEVKRVLAKAIETAEERIPKRAPRPKAPPPAPAPPPPPAAPNQPRAPSALDLEQGLVSLEPSKEPPPPPKRLTVPVGALDAEPEPSLLETHPPQETPPGAMPELAFPTAEELQSVAPAMPPAAAKPAPPAPEPPPAPPQVPLPPPPPPKLELETSIAPPMEGMLGTMPPAPPPAPPPQPPPAAEPPPQRLSVPMMEAMVEPPPAPSGQAPADAWPERRERPSRPSHAIPDEPPHVSQAQARASRASLRMAPPSYAPRESSRWGWRLLALLVVAGVVGVLIWQGVIPIDWLKNLLHREEQQMVEAPPPPPRPAPRPDTVMARDTATVHPRPARPAPTPPPVEEPPRRLAAPTLPPGVSLTRSVMLVSGLQVESVSQIDQEGKSGMSIVQVLSTGQRVTLEEFPTDTVGAAGEIGVTGIPPDTVVGHVRVADLEVRIKAVGIPEDRIVQFLQELVEVKP